MRPYRFISTTELQQLTQYIQQKTEHWANEYALNSLKTTVQLAPKNHQCISPRLIGEYALIEGDFFSLINEVLFDIDAPDFNQTSEALLLRLLDSIVDVKEQQTPARIEQSPDWFYAGSTCLVLLLACKEKSCQIFLHPDWVYTHLSSNHQKSTSTLSPLNEALAEQRITLNLELIPSTVSVQQITTLNIGDVLSTHHPITSPLMLMHGKKRIADAEVGSSQHHKSIVLKEPQ